MMDKPRFTLEVDGGISNANVSLFYKNTVNLT